MSLHMLPEKDLRDYCRRSIENLEIWLRRLIHTQLSAAYGENYIQSQDTSGSYVLNSALRKSITQRYNNNASGRYSRPIDACLFEEEITIICNPVLYTSFFQTALNMAFPLGSTQARNILEKLTEPRNHLSHGNAITIRQAEQVICYVGDIIDSLKSYYAGLNMASQYNAPRFIHMRDSLGNRRDLSQYEPPNIDMLNFKDITSLHVGDTLSIELEVDPSFSPSDYRIEWQPPKGSVCDGARLVLQIELEHVTADFRFFCQLISNNSWHRYGTYDHYIGFLYKVLPPS